jgi:hypothetical protein
VLTTCQPSTVWCSRERLSAAAAQPAQGSSEPVAPRIYLFFYLFKRFFCPMLLWIHCIWSTEYIRIETKRSKLKLWWWWWPVTMAMLSGAWALIVRISLGSYVLIPLKAWVFVSVFFCVALFCVNRGLAKGWTVVQGVVPNVYLKNLPCVRRLSLAIIGVHKVTHLT